MEMSMAQPVEERREGQASEGIICRESEVRAKGAGEHKSGAASDAARWCAIEGGDR